MRRLNAVRNRKQTLKVLKELDAFPKVPENYQQTSASGGSVSIIIFVFIGILVMSEFCKLQINVDLTVAMQCGDIGADVLDLSGSKLEFGDDLKLEPSHFELTREQASWLGMFRQMHAFMEGYRALKVLEQFKSDLPTYMPKRSQGEDKPFDACRIHGSFKVNKVAGNFHVTAGKSIHHPRGHAHLSVLVPVETFNYSHRIDVLSFGPWAPGYINPLDGDIAITDKNLQMYQYYIKIVPTTIKSLNGKETKTNQYSVTQRIREINHESGSHGISGMLHSFIGFLFDVITCKLQWNKKEAKPLTMSEVPPGTSVIQQNGFPTAEQFENLQGREGTKNAQSPASFHGIDMSCSVGRHFEP
ncbi:Endoplasmic reticulum-Golgi intermediate compartment protein 2 [Acropora cervicornis]|uniref:Endoplasmic reticulum-Golgi intermediate compartment protein 2 n=1 Tax=Acropora cervicornis TaxID=6130 RepID=A0AAD9QXP6_ACRCE|nr:Endoplasmic reticulum-Golgi intermediate compartment protein 2 [Acropora cervicornis]